MSGRSIHDSDIIDAADCNPFRDRTFAVLPDVMLDEWSGEETKPSERIGFPSEADHTAFDYPVKREKLTPDSLWVERFEFYFFAEAYRLPISSQFRVFHQAAA